MTLLLKFLMKTFDSKNRLSIIVTLIGEIIVYWCLCAIKNISFNFSNTRLSEMERFNQEAFNHFLHARSVQQNTKDMIDPAACFPGPLLLVMMNYNIESPHHDRVEVVADFFR